MTHTKKASAISTLCLFGFLIAGCAGSRNLGIKVEPAVFTSRATLAEFDLPEYKSMPASQRKNMQRVHVIVSLESDQHGRTFLSTKLLPGKGIHIYAKNLPQDTNTTTYHVNAFGGETTFKLSPNPAISQDGPVFEDAPAYESFVYYSDEVFGISSTYRGAVTLRMPVVLQTKNTEIDAQISIAGLADSNANMTILLMKTVNIKIPAKW